MAHGNDSRLEQRFYSVSSQNRVGPIFAMSGVNALVLQGGRRTCGASSQRETGILPISLERRGGPEGTAELLRWQRASPSPRRTLERAGR